MALVLREDTSGNVFVFPRCSSHPCCPSSWWHLSPLGPRCIANEGLVNHTPVCWGEEAGGPAPWLMPSPLSPSFPSVCIPPSFCFCLNKPSLVSYPSDASVPSHFSNPLSFFNASLAPCFPGVWTFGWGRPEHMVEEELWEELVRRCELNPWLISEDDTVREPSANTSSEDCVCVRWRKRDGGWGLGGDQEQESERKWRREGEGGRDRNWLCSLLLLCAFIFCCCFASVEGCAMNWAVANSLQFVKSSPTVV